MTLTRTHTGTDTRGLGDQRPSRAHVNGQAPTLDRPCLKDHPPPASILVQHVTPLPFRTDLLHTYTHIFVPSSPRTIYQQLPYLVPSFRPRLSTSTPLPTYLSTPLRPTYLRTYLLHVDGHTIPGVESVRGRLQKEDNRLFNNGMLS